MYELDRVRARPEQTLISLALQIMNSSEMVYNLWEAAIGQVASNELVYENPDLDGKRKIVRPAVIFWARQAATFATLYTYLQGTVDVDNTPPQEVSDFITAYNSMRSAYAGLTGSWHGAIGTSVAAHTPEDDREKGMPFLWRDTESNFGPNITGSKLLIGITEGDGDIRVYELDGDGIIGDYDSITTNEMDADEGANTVHPLIAQHGNATGSTSLITTRVDLLSALVDLFEADVAFPAFGDTTSLPYLDQFSANIYVMARYMRETVNPFAELSYKYISDDLYALVAAKYAAVDNG
jgi:hypothetical protein